MNNLDSGGEISLFIVGVGGALILFAMGFFCILEYLRLRHDEDKVHRRGVGTLSVVCVIAGFACMILGACSNIVEN